MRISKVTGLFFANPADSCTSPDNFGRELFRQTFPIINFNPPQRTVSCDAALSVNETTRPFTDVIPLRGGLCSTVVAEGNGHRAGTGTLASFHAVFTGAFTVSSPGQVRFGFYSDDGWILGIGAGPHGAEPAYVNGPRINAPRVTPFSHYAIVGSFNTPSSVAPNALDVKFALAGTYPFELDYTECHRGELALTVTANDRALGLGGPQARSFWEVLMETTTLVATFGLLAFMVERLTNGIAIVAGYSSWWRDRMEVDATADPEIRARVERNRRVGLFALSAILGVIGAVLLKLDFLSKVGFEILPSAPAPVPVPAGNQAAGTSAVYSIQEIGHYVVTGLLIAAGADPIRELLKLGDRPREPPAPLQITGTLILQQPPPAASVKAETDRVSSLSA